MRFTPAELDGVYVVELQPHSDSRGSFTRVFSVDAFAREGLCTEYPEHSIARNVRRGIIRGLHYQSDPHAETKIIRCTRGTVWDVLVDVRPNSRSYGRWMALELDGDVLRLVYVPTGIAHGYQTLSEFSELEYLISARHAPHASRGWRWDSSALGIAWPVADPILSDRDRGHPAFVV